MAKWTIGQYDKISEHEKDKEDWVCYNERIMLLSEANKLEQDSKKESDIIIQRWDRKA